MSSSTNNEENDSEEEFTFEQQLSYCQLYLEEKLKNERISPKAAQSLLRSLKILQSDKASFIKKRQVMRVSCGDYRKDMHDRELAEKKCINELIMNRNEIEKVDHGLCRQFIRKKALNANEEIQAKDSFMFNFPTPENENHLSS